MYKFTTPAIPPSVAIQFPNAGGQINSGLPVPDADDFYFSTAADAQTILALLTAALQSLMADPASTFMGMGSLDWIGMASGLTDQNGNVISSYIGVIDEGVPFCIYEDPTYRIYRISGQVTFRPPQMALGYGPYPLIVLPVADLVGNIIKSCPAAGATKLVAKLTPSATEVGGIMTYVWE